MLGQPAPAYAEGFVVAGFGSGELAALRADSGGVVWTDSLAAAARAALVARLLADPRAAGDQSTGGLRDRRRRLMVALDLRAGRRLWEREIAGEDTPWVAGDWMFVVSAEPADRRDQPRRWPGRLGHPAAALGRPEKKQKDPITWFGPVLAGDRLIVAGHQRGGAVGQPLHRRDPRPVRTVGGRGARSRRWSPTARCS